MENKIKYEIPTLEYIRVDDDIITTSGTETNPENIEGSWDLELG